MNLLLYFTSTFLEVTSIETGRQLRMILDHDMLLLHYLSIRTVLRQRGGLREVVTMIVLGQNFSIAFVAVQIRLNLEPFSLAIIWLQWTTTTTSRS